MIFPINGKQTCNYFLHTMFVESNQTILPQFYEVPDPSIDITNFYRYIYDNGSSPTQIYDGGMDMYDGGNRVRNNNNLQMYRLGIY